MDIFAILSLIGGLALFLYGMNVMGDGLTRFPVVSWKKNSGKTDIKSDQGGITWCRCHRRYPVIIGYNRYGSRFCKLRNYETVPGSRNYHGCQCRYHNYIMDLKSFRY